ncbi:MAG: prepilin-type N-terminal cleavage/methylation domain-containing protein [Gemmatimonadota bacterium]
MLHRRNGFTLLEMIIAIVILVVVATTFGRFAGTFSKAMAQSSIRAIAVGVGTGRLELVRADPRYTRLVTLYGTGPGSDTTGFPNYPGMRRTTKVVRDLAGGRDISTITVRVWDPAFKDTVSVTALVASPQ